MNGHLRLGQSVRAAICSERWLPHVVKCIVQWITDCRATGCYETWLKFG